jgi:transcriptional regulator with XRE-family HTH domain
MNYGSEIRRLRKEAGLTRAQLSELSGVPDRNLGMIEIGHRACSEQLFCAILKVLGYTLEKKVKKIENNSVKS